MYIYITYVYITKIENIHKELSSTYFNTISNLQLSTVSDTKFRYES